MKNIFIILFVFTIFSNALAQNQSDKKVNVTEKELFEKVLKYYNQEKNFNGTVLIAKNGEIEFLSGIGISNRRTMNKINSNTKFKIASISKTFTAVLILQLIGQGKIDLQANFGKYYPNYKGEAKEKVTIQNLLTYSSGIPNILDSLGMMPYKMSLSIDEFIDKYCSGNLEFKPGEKSNYSNTEYIILCKIIENVTKKPFGEILQEKILTPLKMNNTGLLSADKKLLGLTKSYTLNDSSQYLTEDETYLIENYFGAGAMYSTAQDLLKFNNGIFKNKLFNEATTNLMIKPYENLNGVALGVWYSGGYSNFTKPFIYRTGGILGACSNWIYTVDDNKTIIVLSNTNATNLFELSEQFYLVSNGQLPKFTKLKN
jgi:CubicO group peptidase (beta-lactamase class C family)